MPRRILSIVSLTLGVLIAAAIGRLAAERRLNPSAAIQLPDATAELFAPNVVSTPLDELAATFLPGGDTLYYAISSPGPATDQVGVIVTSHRAGKRWTAPVVASFSGRYSDYDPFVTRDGRRLFFVSNRPDTGRTRTRADYDIWMVERNGDTWGEPHNLGAPINTRAPEYYPSVATDGTLYFSSVRPDSKGHFNIYRAHLANGVYGVPENLGPTLNGPFDNIDNVIAPDQSYIIFASYGRPDALGNGDLYISFNRGGAWTAPRNLGAPVNSVALDYTPGLSPDGKYLYWASNRGFEDRPGPRALTLREFRDSIGGIRNGNGNIYRTLLAPLLDRMASSTDAGHPGV